MAVDRLDISIFEEDSAVIVAIAGRLDAAVAPGLREKLDSFSEGGQRIVLDLLRVHSVAEETVRMLLQFLSDLRGQGGTLSLLCVQPDVLERFAPYRNLIEIHPSLASLFRSGFHSGKQRTLKWSRRTGIRITAPLALFLALLLSGWIATLLSLVVWQFHELEVDREELVRLRHERETAQKTVDELETRLKPLADLGLLDMPKGGRRVRAARTGAGAVVGTAASADSSRFMAALRDSIAVERGSLRATDTAKGARP